MKKIIIMITLLLSTFTLIACDGLMGGGSTVETLIIYTNQTSGGRGARLQSLIRQQNFDFDVLFVELSGQNLKNRLVAEKNAPIADVVLGGGVIEHLELKREGVLSPYRPTWLDHVDELYHEAEDYYAPWAVEPLYLVYNKAYYTDNPDLVGTNGLRQAPTGWIDLADNFENEYNVFKITGGTGATIYASILLQYRDANGELGISQEGWDKLYQLIEGGELDRGLWQANLAGNRFPISMTWAGAILDIEAAYEIELGVVMPEEGVPVVVSQVAVVDSKSEARMNAAKLFIEWWGQTETQVAWSEISGQAPANAEAFALVDEDVRRINTATPMVLDWEFIVDNISLWRQKIELDIIAS